MRQLFTNNGVTLTDVEAHVLARFHHRETPFKDRCDRWSDGVLWQAEKRLADLGMLTGRGALWCAKFSRKAKSCARKTAQKHNYCVPYEVLGAYVFTASRATVRDSGWVGYCKPKDGGLFICGLGATPKAAKADARICVLEGLHRERAAEDDWDNS